jgi:hypothetical protein
MIGCNTEKAIGTFTTETIDGCLGTYLCIDNGTESKPIAWFLDDTHVQLFYSIMQQNWKVAQTQGRMGI